jgi:hypothetical protein
MRNSVLLLLLFLSGMMSTAPAKSKKEAPLPRLFCNAQYVSVTTWEGEPDAYLSREYPSDYNAAMGVQNRIEKWGRYHVVYETNPPVDLVFLVWKERKEGNRYPGQPTEMPPPSGPRQPGNSPGAPGQNPQQPGQPGEGPGVWNAPGSAGAQQGRSGVGGMYPLDDQLSVYMSVEDVNQGSPIWRRSEKDGLKEPNMLLFKELADAVDDACSNPK